MNKSCNVNVMFEWGQEYTYIGNGAQIGDIVLVPLAKRRIYGVVCGYSDLTTKCTINHFDIEIVNSIANSIKNSIHNTHNNPTKCCNLPNVNKINSNVKYKTSPNDYRNMVDINKNINSSIPNGRSKFNEDLTKYTGAYHNSKSECGELNKHIKLKEIISINGRLTDKYIKFIKYADLYNMLISKSFIMIRKNTTERYWYKYDNQIYSHSFLIKTLGQRRFDAKIKSGTVRQCEIDFNVDINLSSDQNEARESILKDCSKPILLKGDTGSGKTNVFFSIIAEYKEKQILIIVPEVSLTYEFVKRVQNSFGFAPHIWNHKISDKCKDVIWNWAKSDSCGILIGSRSALWLPFANLGCIVIDEEHDPSYKQENSPKYQARDMSILKANIEGIPIILVSATPSLETWHNVKRDKYRLVELETKTSILGHLIKRSAKDWMSVETKYAIMCSIENGMQCLLFLNRRGFASSVFCTSCNKVLLCKNCSASLILYKNSVTLCTYCDYSHKLQKCECGHYAWRMHGVGIEKIYDEAQLMFPNAKIAMLSSDNKNIEKEIELIYKGYYNIVISTQILSKGHHFPNLGLIVIIQGDHGLISGNPRNTERIYQLLTQVKGRFGQKLPSNRAIIQTIDPQNSILKAIAEGNFNTWVTEEMKSRKDQDLPPFVRLIRIIVSSKSSEKSEMDAFEVYDQLKSINGVTVYNPTPTPLRKYKNSYRWSMLMKFTNNIPQALIKLKTPTNKSKIVFDVDPYSFF